jgi:hypothetical protein
MKTAGTDRQNRTPSPVGSRRSADADTLSLGGERGAKAALVARLRTELEHLPAFAVMVSIRGTEVPLLHPHECEDASMPMRLLDPGLFEELRKLLELRVKEICDAAADRWPGIFVWAWRVVFGEPTIAYPKMPVMDHDPNADTEILLEFCKAVLAPEHRWVLDDLRDGELMSIAQTFIGAQTAWGDAIRTNAAEVVKRVMGGEGRVESGERRSEEEDNAVLASINAGCELRSGGCLPAHMGGGAWGVRRRAEREKRRVESGERRSEGEETPSPVGDAPTSSPSEGRGGPPPGGAAPPPSPQRGEGAEEAA